MDKQSNYIGAFFKQYIFKTGFDRKILIKRLDFNYANNDRMLCAYFLKKDYLWKQSEVDKWCEALYINGTVRYDLVAKSGKKDYDYGE